MAKSVGFDDPRVLSSSPIEIHDAAMKKLLGPTKFYSITARLFKLPGMLEPACEDYGQLAIYKVQTPAAIISLSDMSLAFAESFHLESRM